MPDTLHFQPRREVTAQENLREFIALARNQLTIFGSDLPFDEMAWDLTKYIQLRAKKSALRAVFSSWESANDQHPLPMTAEYALFAKSYFRYQHGMRPTKSIGTRIAALRALGAAHQEFGGGCASKIGTAVFNRASQLIAEKFTAAVAYRVGEQLEMVAELMDSNQLVAVPLSWRSSLARPSEDRGRVGEEFEAKRQKMLPSPFELDALARAFRAAHEPTELVVTSVAALLCCAPDRVNEVLGLRENCEIKPGRDGNQPGYGLRIWSSKGAEPTVKYMVPSMAGVAEMAIARLRVQTQSARDVAKWYEEHPKSMYLPDHLSHLRGRPLSVAELGQVLFVDEVAGPVVSAWCKGNRVETYVVNRRKFIDFDSVEAAVLRRLPKDFPYVDTETGLRFSEALCIARRNEFHRNRATYRGIIELIDQGFLATGLGNRSKHGFPSVFDTLGLFNEDGGPIAIRSHQFRHYLNTLAHRGGMSEFDIAKWSGRKDVRQNSTYNHVSDRDIQARLTELRTSGSPVTVGAEARETRVSLFTRMQMKELNLLAGHVTEFGFCSHDFVMSPCQIHADCMNCNEQVCVKGDREGELNARATEAELKELLAAACDADQNGVYNASQWVKHQELTLKRVQELISILDNPAVPVGSIIKLTHITPASRLQQAENQRELPNARRSETTPRIAMPRRVKAISAVRAKPRTKVAPSVKPNSPLSLSWQVMGKIPVDEPPILPESSLKLTWRAFRGVPWHDPR